MLVSYENSLLERIGALNVATEFLIPHVNAGSRPAVAQWLKADLAALEQLRKQMNKGARDCPPEAMSAIGAIIDAKNVALGRIEKKKPRAKKTVRTERRRVVRALPDGKQPTA